MFLSQFLFCSVCISFSFNIPEFYSVVLFNHCLHHPRLMNFYFSISQILSYLLKDHCLSHCFPPSWTDIVKLAFLYGNSNIVQEVCLPNQNISKYQYNIIIYPLLIIKMMYVFSWWTQFPSTCLSQGQVETI